ncbi:helix-turn-helix domain-containing protein [Pseudomonas protegens]|uniref:helix-turn-helix domain-containing protein n=1 Tax=Pseudomonas protegens TaxID=380021 RepID=UPI0037F29B29
MTLKASFATVLRALRAKRNISQREFADTTSRTHLSKLEAGKSSITLDKLQQLSDRLSLSSLTLLTLTIIESTAESTTELVNKLCGEIRRLASKGEPQTPPTLTPKPPTPVPVRSAYQKRLPASARSSPSTPPAQAELSFCDYRCLKILKGFFDLRAVSGFGLLNCGG